jgi:Co/Zn/Cd efflux system component
MTFAGHDHATEHTPLIQGNNVIVDYVSSCANLASKADSSTKKKLAFATGIALIFFATELVAGYFANSLGKHSIKQVSCMMIDINNNIPIVIALMSDAFHLLSDVASFIVALAAIYLAEKPPTKSKYHDQIVDFYVTNII